MGQPALLQKTDGTKIIQATNADELQQSSFSKESPHPFYVREKETCNSCHMQKTESKYFDVSAKDETITSHRWAAASVCTTASKTVAEVCPPSVKKLQPRKSTV
jgi:hypothetical protein